MNKTVKTPDREAFEKWWDKQRERRDFKPTKRAVWQYFAPHFKGEFPREVASELLERWSYSRHTCNSSGAVEKCRGKYLVELERLWQGGEQQPCGFCLGTGECQGGDGCHGSNIHDCPICEGTGIESCKVCGGTGRTKCPDCDSRKHLSHYPPNPPCPICKPVCPTCGGSREVSRTGVCPGLTKPCPDCTEKPKGPICLKCGYEGGSSERFWENPCKHTYIDQRKGEERRTARAQLAVCQTREGESSRVMWEIRTGYWQYEYRGSEDRRV